MYPYKVLKYTYSRQYVRAKSNISYYVDSFSHKFETSITRSLFTMTNFCSETSLLEEVSCIQKTTIQTQGFFDTYLSNNQASI